MKLALVVLAFLSAALALKCHSLRGQLNCECRKSQALFSLALSAAEGEEQPDEVKGRLCNIRDAEKE